MSGVGCLKHVGTLDLDASGVAEVDGGWSVEAEAGVTVLVVVPVEEALAERTGILDRAEPSGELWAVFQRLELRL